ncbi:putative at hook domain-containing protein [Erysiphe neolycopersici]|uniref:Putative at hook domain-containing protein n=1 Tax=Erysiphe neolycopersici TaxID=212602 RepID=A0A420I2D3_9PEZI|nr:putative at hook domain-containing protein [Erysiphe neolycopersici]
MEREVFSELEKRFLLTQILQASSIPLERIFMLFNEFNEEPRWENIYLPKGRTLQECKFAFEAIRTNTSPFATPNSPGFNRAYFNKRKAGTGSLESSSTLSLESKRRLSGIRGQDIGSQIILPKLSPTESMGSGLECTFTQYPILPRPSSMDSGHSILEVRGGHQHFLPKPASMDPVPSVLEVRGSHQHILPKPSPILDSGPSVPEIAVKKRCRPPKAEVERRQQALAHGELNSPQAMTSQIQYKAPREISGIASSSSISSQVSTSSPKSGLVVKKSGPLRQPGEGRFSLNDYIKPTDRQSPSKTKKKPLAVITTAGPELSTPNIPTRATSKVAPSPKTPVSHILLTEAQNFEISPRKLDKNSPKEPYNRF